MEKSWEFFQCEDPNMLYKLYPEVDMDNLAWRVAIHPGKFTPAAARYLQIKGTLNEVMKLAKERIARTVPKISRQSGEEILDEVLKRAQSMPGPVGCLIRSHERADLEYWDSEIEKEWHEDRSDAIVYTTVDSLTILTPEACRYMADVGIIQGIAYAIYYARGEELKDLPKEEVVRNVCPMIADLLPPEW